MLDTKLCIKCNKVKPLSMFHNNRATKDGKTVYCAECINKHSKLKRDERKNDPHYIYKRIMTRTGYYAKYAPHRSKAVPITEKEFTTWYNSQPRECAYCGIKEHEIGTLGYNKRKRQLTIDCANNDLGYAKNNLVLCCHKCNFIKCDIFTHGQMLVIGDMFLIPLINKLRNNKQ